MYYPYYSMNLSYLLFLLPAILLALWAQIHVQSTFNKYNRRLSVRGISGRQAAQMILERNGIRDVRIVQVQGKLNDSYDPGNHIIRLSAPVFSGISVASIGVAAHEAGHAVQYREGYSPIKIRNAIVPVTRFGSSLALPLIVVGFFMAWASLVFAGIILFSLAVLFQLITLPVEFNASSRALRILDDNGILYGEELAGAKKVLRAAALTYVAAMLVSLAYLLQYLMIFMGLRRRD